MFDNATLQWTLFSVPDSAAAEKDVSKGVCRTEMTPKYPSLVLVAVCVFVSRLCVSVCGRWRGRGGSGRGAGGGGEGRRSREGCQEGTNYSANCRSSTARQLFAATRETTELHIDLDSSSVTVPYPREGEKSICFGTRERHEAFRREARTIPARSIRVPRNSRCFGVA